MAYPKISIVTASYNQGAYLERTIQSILGQNYPNLEYIIIDGGSTDNSVEIIKKYQSQLAYWVSEPDKGLYHAIQKGFEKSTGEIMAWLNSDDIYFKGTLFTVADIFDRYKQIEWLTANPACIDEDDRIVQTIFAESLCRIKYYSGIIKWIQQESTFWRRSLWEKAGGRLNTDLKLAADFALWVSFFEYAELETIDTCLAGFRFRKENQKSLEQFDQYLKEAEAARAKMVLNQKEKDFLKKKEKYKRLLKIPMYARFKFLEKKFWIKDGRDGRDILNGPSKIHFDRNEYKFKKKQN